MLALLVGLNRKCSEILYIALGVIAGVLAFLPYVWALKAQRNVTETSNLSYMSILVLALVGSFAVLVAATAAVIVLNREAALPFAGGEAAGLIVSAMGYGIWRVLLRNRGQEGSPKSCDTQLHEDSERKGGK